ncbi:hypothetical protein BR63_19040 [Thermanaerosceptrum fracticalcis]|uniref:Uncharacterized protein n=1 Tax=Thermanaerosceptrum fracticalcis TaxID=1712410 RepID=A0A7G6E7X5_THEFR|nr:hypothetical protein [Thermanaerosceptrum fracticalcis]QNB48179.1 hypothetical protein BR63_19040 [Thermanaerosceptrum fracticalcis]
MTTIYCPRNDCQYCKEEICQRDAIDLCSPPGKFPYCICLEIRKTPAGIATEQERTKKIIIQNDFIIEEKDKQLAWNWEEDNQ